LGVILHPWGTAPSPLLNLLFEVFLSQHRSAET